MEIKDNTKKTYNGNKQIVEMSKNKKIKNYKKTIK